MPEQLQTSGMQGVLAALYQVFCVLSNIVMAAVFQLYAEPKNVKDKKRKDKSATGLFGDDETAEHAACIVSVKVKLAQNLPKMDVSGLTDAYVKATIGAKTFSTKTVDNSLSPVWNYDFQVEQRKDSPAEFVFSVMDSDVGNDSTIGTVKIPVKEVIAQRTITKEFEIIGTDGKPCVGDNGRKSMLVLELSYQQAAGSGEATWLNGILSKAYVEFSDMVEGIVKKTLTDTFAGLNLPVVKLALDSFELGHSAPWMMNLQLLPSRYDEDLQINCRLRYVADGDMIVKVNATAGPMTVSASVSSLELEFPAWIQLRLQCGDKAKPIMTAFQLAATDEPKIRFNIALAGFTLGSIPGVESSIDFAIRTALRNVLVLPKKISNVSPGCTLDLKKDPKKEAAVGRVSVKLYEAADLELKGALASLGKADPFLLVNMTSDPKNQLKTKTIQNNTSPKFNEYAEFFVTNEQTDALEVKVMDDGLRDSTLGTVKLEIKALAESEGWREGWYELSGTDTGKLKMAVEYARFADTDGPKAVVKSIEPKKDAEIKPTKKADVAQYGNLKVVVRSASNLPACDYMSGSSDPYVTICLEGGVKRTTKHKEKELNPLWEEEFGFLESVKSKKKVMLEVKDKNTSGYDEAIGTLELEVAALIGQYQADPTSTQSKEFEIQKDGKPVNGKDGKPSKITISVFFEPDVASAATDMGADWLNGALRKGYRLFLPMIWAIAKERLEAILAGLTNIPACKSFTLKEFVMGEEGPWFMSLDLLPSRSDQDLQLGARLRWVTNKDMKLVIDVKTSLGTVNVSATNLELEFPAWIQARIQGNGEPLLTSFKCAATEEPVVKMKLSLGSCPLGVMGLEGTVDGVIRNVIHSILVLPNKIDVPFPPAGADAATWKPPALLFRGEQERAVGRLHVKILDGEGLVDPDFWGTMDPYLVLKVGSQIQTSKTEYDTSDPKWNMAMDFLVLDDKLDKLDVKVFDRDMGKSDLRGEFSIKVADCKTVSGWNTKWFPIRTGGRVRLSIRYAPFVENEGPKAPPSSVEDLMAQTQVMMASPDMVTTGKIVVTVEKARNLPSVDLFGGCDPYVEVSSGGKEYKTAKKDGNMNPDFGDFFLFERGNALFKVDLAVKDFEGVGKNRSLGTVSISVDKMKHGQKQVGPVGGAFQIMNEVTSKDGKKSMVPIKGKDGKASLLYANVAFYPPEGATSTAGGAAGGAPAKVLTGKLRIIICMAENLPAADSGGYSDPFVELYSGSKQILKTQTIKGSLMPVWNEAVVVDRAETLNEVKVRVLDWDMGLGNANDLLGEAAISVADLQRGVELSDVYALTNPKDGKVVVGKNGQQANIRVACKILTEEELKPKVKAAPAVPVPVVPPAGAAVAAATPSKPRVTSGNLLVQVAQCNNLPAADRDGKADPFVVVKSGAQKLIETPVASNTLNPVWSPPAEAIVDRFYAKESLEVTVMDKNSMTANTTMGSGVLNILDVRPGEPLLLDRGGTIPLMNDKSGLVKNKDGEKSSVSLNVRFLVSEPTTEIAEARVKVEVQRCTDLKKMDTFNESDGFVVVKLGGVEQKTEVKNNNANPVFHQAFWFSSSTDSRNALVMDVRDDETAGSRSIGEVRVPFEEVLKSPGWVMQKSVALTDSAGKPVTGKSGKPSTLDFKVTMFRLA